MSSNKPTQQETAALTRKLKQQIAYGQAAYNLAKDLYIRAASPILTRGNDKHFPYSDLSLACLRAAESFIGMSLEITDANNH